MLCIYAYTLITVTAQALNDAAEVLGIQEQASFNEIRLRYHEQIRIWHPDVSRTGIGASHEMTIRFEETYGLLTDYCMNRSFSFRIENLEKDLEQSPEDYWMERFGDDPIWG